MKKQLLTKMLLTVAMLGAGSSAVWGSTKTVTLFSQNFETVTPETFSALTAGTASTIWTKSSSYPATLITNDATYGNYVSCAGTNSDNYQVSNSIWFYTGGTDIYTYNEEDIKTYTIEFDALLYTYTRDSRFVLFMDGATVPLSDTDWGEPGQTIVSSYIFAYSNSKWKNTSVNINTHNNASFSLSETDWYHYKFDIDGSSSSSVSITYTITNNATGSTVKTGTYSVDLTAESPICNSYKCQGIYIGKARYDGKLYADNFIVRAQVETEEDVANDPTFSLVGINGTNRTYRINYAEGETLHYAFSTSGLPNSEDYTTTSGSTYYDYEITTSGTIYAYTTKASATSETVAQTVTASTVTLAAPRFTRGAYSDGKYSITITSDQTYVALQPDVILKYRIGDSGEYSNYSTAVSVPEGSTLYAYSYNANYANSDVTSTVTGNRSAITSGDWSAEMVIDFKKSTRGGDSFSLSEEGTFTVSGSTYKPVILNSITHDNFGMTSTNNILLSSSNNSYDGLYPWSANINAGIKDLREGQYVLISTNNAAQIGSPSSNLTLCEEFNTNTDRIYRVNADGNASFAFNKGSFVYLYDVTVCQQTISGTITAAGWSTFASEYPLDLSTITGGTAYYASAASGSTVTLTTTTATVPAGEGIMVKGTAGETFTIDVAASGTAISGNLLKGQTTTGNVTASTSGTYHYVFGFNKSNASIYGFYNLDAATEVAAGKAYLETATELSAASSRISIVFDEESTGIGTTLMNNETVNNEMYNLQGQRVESPSKGLYIMNGKKVILK